MNTILQGTEFKKDAVEGAQMVLFNGMDKYIVDAIEEDGKFFIYASADTTKEWHPGKYSYQMFAAASSLLEEGELKVKANLLYSTEIYSFWKKALHAVEDRIAGKAIDPANDVSVADKRISYYRLDELLKLREFIIQKITEEDAEEEGIKTVSPNDQKRIIYAWRGI